MNDKIETGNILTLAEGKYRMIYLGDRKCDVQAFIPERSATGGLTHSGNGEWTTTKKAQGLNEAQIARWIEVNKL